ncbi:hypothetical protein [Burkholderia sp. GbtcB21]|uniref:hypothetical protein n=1 Tax=Burkholderia sp. GbtcB21 TaxID=2824766 RepID=UPI001C2FAF90|nr:hypothetical protein [Burkholderia sp. GbtcB21]
MSAFDDYLNAPGAAPQQDFGAYLGAPAAPAVVPPALRVPQASNQPQGQWQVPGSVTMGIGDVVRGGAQDVVHGLSWLANKIAPNSQFAKDASAALPQMQQTIDTQNAQYAAQRAGQQPQTLSGIVTGQQSTPGTDWGRLAGNAIGTLPVMAMGGGTGLAGRVGMGALQGATSAALMPTTGNSDQSFGQQKMQQAGIGGLMGASIPLAYEGAKAVGTGLWNAARPVLQPERYVGEGMSSLMNPSEAAAAAANIRGAQTFVPGSQPTTAQVAGNPMLVQTEKAAGNIPAFKTAAAERAIQNNNARWQTLMGVAQTPEALQAAQAAREDATFPLYAAAGDQTAGAGKALVKLFQRPAMMQAAQQADMLAANRGETLVWPQQGGDMSINGRALDYTNRALRDMIGNAKASGNKELASGLADAQSQLQAWTSRYIPAQREAARVYAQMSVPVNTMEAGQAIANGLGTRAMNAGGVPEIQMMPFRSALTSAMKNAPYGIDADALRQLQGIGQDLQRATISNSIRSPGSDTAYNLAAQGWLARQLYGPTFGGAGNVGKAVGALGATALGHPMAGLGILGAGNKIGQMVGGRLQDRLTGLLMDPNAVLPYLDARAAAAAQSVPNPLMQGLLNYGRPAITNGLVGGLVNAHQ